MAISALFTTGRGRFLRGATVAEAALRHGETAAEDGPYRSQETKPAATSVSPVPTMVSSPAVTAIR